jgi:hypothetical protein
MFFTSLSNWIDDCRFARDSVILNLEYIGLEPVVSLLLHGRLPATQRCRSARGEEGRINQ